MTPTLLRLHLNAHPSWTPAVRHALDVLLDLIGIRYQVVADAGEADLIYGPRDGADQSRAAVWLRPHPAVSSERGQGTTAGVEILGELLAASHGVATDADPVLLTHLCLEGTVEGTLARDPYGVPKFRMLPDPLAPAVTRPLVNQLAANLEVRLRAVLGDTLVTLPRWPEGKTFVIALTHDVDEPYLHRRARYFRRRLRLALGDGRYRLAARSAVAALVAGVSETAGMRPAPADDPNFGFSSWMEFERSIGARSTFYTATTDSATAGSSLEDVAYDATDPFLSAALRWCVDQGWEVSLHASINAKDVDARMTAERAALAAIVAPAPVVGVRHHYWAIDCDRPLTTWRQHADAGLCYDSSLGMNDRVGFRRGIAWPFRPLDAARGEAIDLVQIPPTMMDGGVVASGRSREELKHVISEHLATVRSIGGLAVLDWHLEQSNPQRQAGVGPLLREVLREVAGTAGVGWMTAAEVTDWWTRRRQMLAS